MSNNKRGGGNGFGLKLFAAITSLLLAASVITTGVCFGTGIWQVTPDEPVQEQHGNEEAGAILGEEESHGLSLMSAKIATSDYEAYDVSELAESAYTITATITPSDTTNQTISWSAAFENPSSTWASGKDVNDYLELKPSSDTKQLTVSVLSGFSEPIIITGVSNSNPEVKATCQVDYIKSVTGVKIGTVSNGNNATLKFDSSNTIYFTPTYSEGTLQGDISFSSLTLNVNSTFKNYVSSHISGNSTQYTFKSSLTAPFTSFGGSALSYTFNLGSAAEEFCQAMGNTAGIYPQFTNAFIQAINNYQGNNDHGSLTCTYTYTYDGVTISSGTASTSKLWYSSEGLAVYATDMGLSDSNIIFKPVDAV